MTTVLHESKSQRRLSCRRHTCVLLLGGALWLGLSPPLRAEPASAEILLIVNPANRTLSAGRDFVAAVFLKKTTRWSGGENIRPVDQRQDSIARRIFSATILRRSVPSMRSYWQQRIFSGRDVPPPELDSDAEVVAYVLRNPGAIGYVSAAAKLGDAKILTLR